MPDKKKGEKINSEINRSSGHLVDALDSGSKRKMKEISKDKNTSDSMPSSHKSQVVHNPCTQIYELTHIKPKNSREVSPTDNKKYNLKCPEYGSDEFADVEDNARDSSSDNGESVSNVQLTLPVNRYMKDAFPSESEKQLQPFKTVEEFVTTSGSSSESEMVSDQNGEEASEDKTDSTGKKYAGASCSYLLQNNSNFKKSFSVPKASEGGNKKTKYIMPTIAEVAESEDKKNNSKDSQPSHSKANPLKMKTKVGIRKDRCNICKVRLGLCAIKCRCGGYYCAKHRYDKEHNCSFDYKSMGAEEIRRNNPKVIAEKIRKL